MTCNIPLYFRNRTLENDIRDMTCLHNYKLHLAGYDKVTYLQCLKIQFL